MISYTRKYTTVAALLGLSTAPLLGAGFQLAERSVSGLGRAFSGEAAIADDASVIASNVAGMILLDDNAISAGLQYINPGVDVKGNTAGGTASDSDVADDAIKLNDCYNLDIAYTHIFADDVNIRTPAGGGNEGQFSGTVGGDVDIFGIGISGSF